MNLVNKKGIHMQSNSLFGFSFNFIMLVLLINFSELNFNQIVDELYSMFSFVYFLYNSINYHGNIV